MVNLLVEIGIQVRLQNKLQRAQLRFFLRLEGAGVLQHFAVAVPQNICRKPPVQPQHARFERGRQNRLEKRLPGLEVLSRDRHFMLLRQLPQRRHVHGQVWRSVSIRDAAGNRRPGIQHRGRNRRVILFHRGFKRFRRGVDLVRLHEHFRRAAPQHYHARTAVLFLELRNVVLHLQRDVVLRLSLLHILAVQHLHVFLIKRRGHRLDFREESLHQRQMMRIQHARFRRRFVGTVRKNIPAAEHHVFQPRQLYKILDFR